MLQWLTGNPKYHEVSEFKRQVPHALEVPPDPGTVLGADRS